jgi:hypothetical protein
MLSNTIKFMFTLHSKKLVESAMLLRPQLNRYRKLNPSKASLLVNTTQPPEPLSFKIHPTA